MKLFKKRDTSSALPQGNSPSGSLDKSPSVINHSAQNNQNGVAVPQYPWSSRRISSSNPFPRYGHASNMQAGKDADIFVFAGLVKEKAMNDLWVVNAVELDSRQIATNGESPSPRVGHAALLIGNAFIVFGGDTKLNGDDANPNNDDNLYLLNTSTTTWTVAKVAGAKPSGRYGHTLNMLGPKVLVFGGQVEGFFFNDLVAFDLNTLNHANPRWELISPIDGSEPPQARTNHIAVTHADKLYIFGGTNGVDWFNDMWRFDPVVRTWTLLRGSGFVPQPREGHSASLVGDVIYIFGGRDVDGNDLGDLSAFKISTTRWFTFQNMGPGPSPRSGHALCTVGKRIYVVGGEGASSRGDEQNAYILDTTKIRYPAETRPPGHRNENTSNPSDLAQGSSPNSKVSEIPQLQMQQGPPYRGGTSIRSVSGQSTTSISRLPQSNVQRQPRDNPRYQSGPISNRRTSYQTAESSPGSSARQPPRESQIRKPSLSAVGASQHSATSQANVLAASQGALVTDPSGIPRSGSLDSMMDLNEFANSERAPESGVQKAVSMQPTSISRLSKARSLEEIGKSQSSNSNHGTDAVAQVQKNPRQLVTPLAMYDDLEPRQGVSSIDTRANLANSTSRAPRPDVQGYTAAGKTSDTNTEFYVSQQGPQSVPKADDEHEVLVSRIAWLSAELESARKAGYSPVQQQRGVDDFPDHDLTPTLLRIHEQLAKMKGTLHIAQSDAEEKIKLANAERDVALRESAYEKARNEAFINSNPDLLHRIEAQRNGELEARLAESAARQSDLIDEVTSLRTSIDEAKRDKTAHQDSLQAHTIASMQVQEEHAELLKNHSVLQSQLAEARNAVLDHQSRALEFQSSLKAQKIDSGRLVDLEARHTKGLSALEAAHLSIEAGNNRSLAAENNLEQERQRSRSLQERLGHLQGQIESMKNDLNVHISSKKDLEAELLTTRQDAQAAKLVVASGLEQLVTQSRSCGPHDPSSHKLELENLQKELQESRELHAQSRSLLDEHALRANGAQANTSSLEIANHQLTQRAIAMKQQLSDTQLELDRLRSEQQTLLARSKKMEMDLESSNMRHGALEQLLTSRPVRKETNERRRSRTITSPVSSGRSSQTPDAGRLRELEQKLVESAALQRDMQASHQKAIKEIEALTTRHQESRARQENAETRARALESALSGSVSVNSEARELSQANGYHVSGTYEELRAAQYRATEAEKQLSESTLNFKERLGQLEADYQSAVHYVKGTEKMLRRMKEELGKYKTSNAKLQNQLEAAAGPQTRDQGPGSNYSDPQAVIKDSETPLAASYAGGSSGSGQNSRGVSNTAFVPGSAARMGAGLAGASAMTGDESLFHPTGAEAAKEKLKEQLSQANDAARQAQLEKQEMERRMNESDAKVKLLLDQFENSVDSYRRQSQILTRPASPGTETRNNNYGEQDFQHDGPLPLPGTLGTAHRTSSALDLLATELDQLRTRWEAGHQKRTSTHRISESTVTEQTEDVYHHGSDSPQAAPINGLMSLSSPLGRPVNSRTSSAYDTALDTMRNKRSRGLKSPRAEEEEQEEEDARSKAA